MAQTGRMSKVHDAHADSMYSPMSASAKAEEWGRKEPPREMHAISPTLSHHAKHPSPGLAQGRWSHQPGGPEQDITPLRSSFQQEAVGPGTGQIKDPNLHEQYFGGDDEVNDLPGSADGQYPYYHDDQRGQLHMQDYERGRFV
jgi:hypothetical protein